LSYFCRNAAFALEEDEEEPTLPVIGLCAGSCSRLGPRSSNEDRCVALTNLYQVVNEYMSKCNPHHQNHVSFYGDDRGPDWKNLANPPRYGSHTDAYFAVYDGHSGSLASQFLSNVLHHSIYT
jgi:serine/threonine protein phosphatase PrpC